ncbi:MAG: helix-turn-helix transcriptional regulator [Deltaproteobacteria bacterium]|nr:helix-turn-helix transcriptional regulator [Deltaproteobacteria bacterium]
MSEKIKEIGSRIHDLRESSDISAAQFGKILGISPETYSDYESGKQDIPASVLFKIAQELKVDMSLLLTGKEPHMNIYTVTRKDKGINVERHSDYSYQNLAPNFHHKKAEPFLVTVEPKLPETPVSINSHPGQEFDYVLEGTLKITIHDHEILLEAGDSIFFDSSYGHGMESLNNKVAKFLAIIF